MIRIHSGRAKARQQGQEAEGSHLDLQAPGRECKPEVEHGLEASKLALSNILFPARLHL